MNQVLNLVTNHSGYYSKKWLIKAEGYQKFK
jgi:hypothetical protein